MPSLNAIRDRYSALCALCLTCKMLFSLAVEELYGDVWLFTVARMERFAGFPQLGHARNTMMTAGVKVKALYLANGDSAKLNRVDEGELLRHIFIRAGSSLVQHLDLAKLSIKMSNFDWFEGFQTMNLKLVVLVADRKRPTSKLASLSSLTMTDVSCVGIGKIKSFGQPEAFLNAEVMPNLETLSLLRANYNGLYPTIPIPPRLVSQLTTITLNGISIWLDVFSGGFWTQLNSLRHLVTSCEQPRLDAALAWLPAPLATLDVSLPISVPPGFRSLGIVWDWNPHLTSLSSLQRLTLPDKETWGTGQKSAKLSKIEAGGRALRVDVRFAEPQGEAA